VFKTVKPSRRRLLRAALITVIGAALLIAAAGPILSQVFSDKIKAKLEASNMHIRSVGINLFARSITLHDVEWRKDSTHKADIHQARASGISIVNWIRGRHISIKSLTFNGGKVELSIDTTQAVKRDSINVSGINIDRILFDDVDVTIRKDTLVEYRGKVKAVIHFLAAKDLDDYSVRNVETYVSDFSMTNAGGLYSLRIKTFSFDKELKKLHIDSLKLEPVLNKEDFAKKVKSQQTRTSLILGSVDAEGVNMAVHMEDTSFMISSLIINGGVVHAYKNKKYPFKRKEKFPLPMASFQSLPFGIEVDTVKLHRSTITYEELPTEGYHTSHITFEDVEATMNSVNNRAFRNLSGISTLEASARVMKSGSIKATFKLPLEEKQKYTAEGTITNFPLHELNPLLRDLAFVEISSGRLNKMNFAFTYDDVGSQGQVRFDYENLKIRGLKKEPEKQFAAFKTMLINTAVKNAETLTGNINVQRNQKKAVFNLWTISLVDGIKNALMPDVVKKAKDNKDKKDKKDKGK
jgi:hypothetical protein